MLPDNALTSVPFGLKLQSKRYYSRAQMALHLFVVHLRDFFVPIIAFPTKSDLIVSELKSIVDCDSSWSDIRLLYGANYTRNCNSPRTHVRGWRSSSLSWSGKMP